MYSHVVTTFILSLTVQRLYFYAYKIYLSSQVQGIHFYSFNTSHSLLSFEEYLMDTCIFIEHI